MRKLIVTLCLFIMTLTAQADIPKKELWARWEVNDPVSTKTINHSEWDEFLKKYVVTTASGISMIPYDKVSRHYRNAVNEYVWSLSQVKIGEYNRREQLAYWINLYNALIVKTVLDHYPVDSINDVNISPGFFSDGPWGAKMLKVEGVILTLDDIEHRILRPIYNDPRIIYALNKAAISSPNLQNEAYRSKNIEELLNKAAKNYVNSLRGVQVINGELVTSSLYTWYIDDFGGTEADVIAHIKDFAYPSLRHRLNSVTRINRTLFNWHLNNAQPRKIVIKSKS